MPNNTLEKWEEKTLGEVCTITAGQSPESQFYNTEGNGLPFYQGKKEFTNKYIGAPTVWTTKITKEALAGDILMSVRAPVGPINYATQKCCIGRGLASIRKSEKISNNFLFYYLLSIQEEIGGHNGAVFNSISRNEIATLKIKLPPLSEQQRIVGVLDEAFENIEKAKQNTLQNLDNIKELYNVQKENIFKVILDKKPVDFGSIIETLTDYHANGSYKLLKEHVELLDNDDYAWMIRSTDFENNFNNSFKYINESAYNFLEKTKVYGNEIIMSKIGNAGKIYLMPVVNRPVSLAMNLFLIRVKEKYAVSSYVYHFLLTDIGQKQISERCKGAATQTITKDSVRSIKIYLPDSIEEQQKIVEQLDELQEETKKLEIIYEQKLKDLDELKQSLLQKAFNGEL